MKIRITKKRLPKAQEGLECPIGYVKDENGNCVPEFPQKFNVNPVLSGPSPAATTPAPPVFNDFTAGNNPMWTMGQQSNVPIPRQTVVKPDGTKVTTGNFGDPTVLYEMSNQGTPTVQTNPIVPIGGNQGPTNFQKIAGKVDEIGDVMRVGIGLGSMIVDSVENRRRQREFNRFLRNQLNTDSLFKPVTGSRGDYVTTGSRFGEFRPNQYVANRGMFAEEGGQYEQPMRIRITKSPASPQEMEYGGQSNYGLDLGRRKVYTDMPESKAESVSSTIPVVPRYAANIEAERGETVYGDMDGDGGLEHFKIPGKRHSQGGSPLNVPVGSFIFSDTAKMRIKDPAILAMFGKTVTKNNRKGYTPAALAKQYDINKYKAIMEDPNADPLSKSTAQLMVNNYEKKLGGLAMIQEGMKGFPQGIPQVAQQAMGGGMMKAEYGGYALPEFQGTQGSSQVNLPFIPEAFRITPQARNLINQAIGRPGPAAGQPQVTTTTTASPAQLAALSDPEFQRYMDLLKKYDAGTRTDARVIQNMTDADAREFARLATKFGFKRTDDKGNEAFRVIQSSTPGFTIGQGKTKRGFFGGYTPQMYERRVVEDVLGEDAVKNMSEVDIRKAYLKELGIDTAGIPEAKLKDAKKLYTDPKFFDEVFYPKFTQRFAKGDYRTMLGDDKLIGAEHYDAYRSNKKPPETDTTVTGHICLGVDANGYPQIQSSSYMNDEARVAAGAYASRQEAMMNCNQQTGNTDEIEGGNTEQGRFAYMTPDMVNLAAAAIGRPRKYLPFRAPINLPRVSPTFYDPNREIAAQNEAANMLAQNAALFGNPQAYMANAARLQGNLAEGVANTIGRVQNQNVNVANQFAGLNADIVGRENLLAAQRANDLFDANVIANQQFDNARRQYNRNLARAFGQAWNNRMNLGLVNAVNPFYNIDPLSGRSFFKSGFGVQDLGRMGSSAAASAGGNLSGYRNFANLKRELQGMGLSDSKAESEALTILKGGVSSYSDNNMDGFPDRMSMTRRGMPMNYMASSILPMQLLAGLMNRSGGGNMFGSE